jgi:NADPH-dependent 2,4-dienoyl-CoA reductase/sulfur reductase-like enzyme
VHAELTGHRVEVRPAPPSRPSARPHRDSSGRLRVEAVTAVSEPVTRHADLVLVVAGVRPDADLARTAGAQQGAQGAITVDPMMRTGLPDIYAAGDCVITHHRLLGETYLPLGTIAHKQGQVAGANAVGGNRNSSAVSVPTW